MLELHRQGKTALPCRCFIVTRWYLQPVGLDTHLNKNMDFSRAGKNMLGSLPPKIKETHFCLLRN